MKNLFVIALLLFGFTNYAQGKKSDNKKNNMEQMSPAQRNELQLKQMTLNLDLNQAQQKEMSVVINEMSANRESHKAAMNAMKEKGQKPTADQKFEMKNKMLDEKIVMKSKIQKILTPKQFEKWEQIQQNRDKNPKKGNNKNNKPKED